MNARVPLPDLERLIDEIGLTLVAPAFEPERLTYALVFDELGRGPGPWRLARAQRELARLHLRELARLLRRAIAWRERSARGDATGADPCGISECERSASRPSLCAERAEPDGAEPLWAAPRAPRGRARWHRSLAQALSLAAADGARPTPRLLELFARLRREPERWPESSELARAALALHDCAAGRVALARAWMREGRRQAAVGELIEALRRRPGRATEARALAALVELRATRSA
jgi:hypothetical protein